MKNKLFPKGTVYLLSSLAFLMIWFLFFYLTFYFYFKNNINSLILLRNFADNLQNIVEFYLAVGFFLVIFSIWFVKKFYRGK